ncbi:MAG: heavy-metal-associated domain-containing protein [Acidimicrobiia bacterium]
MTHLTFSVPDIHCDHCKHSIEQAVGGLGGVDKVEVQIEQRTVHVEFDESMTGRDTIVEAIEDQGYEVAASQLRQARPQPTHSHDDRDLEN